MYKLKCRHWDTLQSTQMYACSQLNSVTSGSNCFSGPENKFTSNELTGGKFLHLREKSALATKQSRSHFHTERRPLHRGLTLDSSTLHCINKYAVVKGQERIITSFCSQWLHSWWVAQFWLWLSSSFQVLLLPVCWRESTRHIVTTKQMTKPLMRYRQSQFNVLQIS